METPNKGTIITAEANTPFPSDRFPLTRTKRIKGGRHTSYRSILDCTLALSHERMSYGMEVVIEENRSMALPMGEYVMYRLPWQKDNEPSTPVIRLPEDENGNEVLTGYTKIELTEANWLDFFRARPGNKQMAGEYKERFAPDYDGNFYDGKPSWVNRKMPPVDEQDPAWAEANWSMSLDALTHKWKSHTYGDNPWSLPYPLYGTYEPMDYVDIRQLYVLKTAGAPADVPYSIIDANGNEVLNNNPVDSTYGKWLDVGVLPAGALLADYNLWEIQGPKDVYTILQGPWSKPKIIPINGDLIRYSSSVTPHPGTLVSTTETAADGTPGDTKLNDAGLVAVPNHKQHRYRWTRKQVDATTYTEWTHEQFAEESGEYVEFIFRNIPETLVEYMLDNPDALFTAEMGGDGKPFRPQGKDAPGWSDKPLKPEPGKIGIRSSGIKFFNKELKGPWADPVPDGTRNTFADSITSDLGDDFKYNAAGVCTTPTINLTANLYLGDFDLTTTGRVAYAWERVYNGGDVTPLAFGTTRSIAVTNTDVNGKAVFRCTMTYTNEAGVATKIVSEYVMLDVKDGRNARLLKIHASNYAFIESGGTATPSFIRLQAWTENVLDADGKLTWKRKPASDVTPWADVANLVVVDDTLDVTPADMGVESEYIYYCEGKDATGAIFYDQVNLHKRVLTNGADAFWSLLTNPSESVATNPDGSLVDPTMANHNTNYQVFDGGTEVTSSFDNVSLVVRDVVLADTALTGAMNDVTASVDMASHKIQLTAWGSNVRMATVAITFARTTDTKVLYQDFKLRRQKGFDELYVLDLDVLGGMTFAPGDTADKTVKAFIYRNGSPIDDADYATIPIKFYHEKQPYTGDSSTWWENQPHASGRTATVTVDDVDFKLTFTCIAEMPNGMKLVRRIVITEVKDSKKQWILFGGYRTKPTKEAEVTAIPKVFGEVTGRKIDYSKYIAGAAGGYECAPRPSVGLIDEDEYWKRNGLRIKINSLDPLSMSDMGGNIWVTDELEVLHNAAWADNVYWICYGKEDPADATSVIWGPWIRVAGEHAAAGQNGGYAVSYYHLANKATNVDKPLDNNASYSPLDANGNYKAYFDDQNARRWHRYLSDLGSFDKTSKRAWKADAFIGFDVENKVQFKHWIGVSPITGTDGVSVKGDPGTDGSKIHFVTSVPTETFGEVGDFAFNNARYWYEKTGETKWEYRGDAKGLKGDKGDKGDPGPVVSRVGVKHGVAATTSEYHGILSTTEKVIPGEYVIYNPTSSKSIMNLMGMVSIGYYPQSNYSAAMTVYVKAYKRTHGTTTDTFIGNIGAMKFSVNDDSQNQPAYVAIPFAAQLMSGTGTNNMPAGDELVLKLSGLHNSSYWVSITRIDYSGISFVLV